MISGFFIKQLLLVPLGMPRNNLDFLNIVKLFVFVNDFPAKYTIIAGQKIVKALNR
jgi:hypothetical protein